MLANPATIIYWNRGDGEKVTGKKAFLMGARSWLFSDGERCAAALLSPHCFPKPPHAAQSACLPSAAVAHWKLGREGLPEWSKGYPHE
jgi:hypothetical protein